jgi:hypothetical protein
MCWIAGVSIRFGDNGRTRCSVSASRLYKRFTRSALAVDIAPSEGRPRGSAACWVTVQNSLTQLGAAAAEVRGVEGMRHPVLSAGEVSAIEDLGERKLDGLQPRYPSANEKQ